MNTRPRQILWPTALLLALSLNSWAQPGGRFASPRIRLSDSRMPKTAQRDFQPTAYNPQPTGIAANDSQQDARNPKASTGKPPAVPPIVIELAGNTIELKESGTPSELAADKPVGIRIGSVMPRWRILCQAEPAKGPDGAMIAPENLFLQMSGSAEQNGMDRSLDQPVVVTQGKATGPQLADAGTLMIRAKVGLDVPPGEYRGKIRVFAEPVNTSDSPTQLKASSIKLRTLETGSRDSSVINNPAMGTISYCCWVPEIVNFTITGDDMDFGSVQPAAAGEVLRICENTTKVAMETNQKNVRVNFAMASPFLEAMPSVRFPVERTALAYAGSSAQAMTNATATPIGNRSLTLDLKKGKTTIYLAGKVAIKFSDPPGQYKGAITITPSVN